MPSRTAPQTEDRMTKMAGRSRMLLAVAAALLAAVYFFPLWNVSLLAPQYPEGLGMHIWASTITGLKPNDLENINNLNHYIGMKRIVPDSIPELRLMPAIIGVLMALGLGAAAWGRRAAARTWVGLFAVLAIAGLVDFWQWEYDYGHDLDMENAIIKVPGMTYQPPLIGSKQLLNFTATSLPAAGGIAAMISLGLGVVVVLTDRRPRTTSAREVTAAAAALPISVA
jgi:copper chaperone NosL